MDLRVEEILDYWFGQLNDDYDKGDKGSLWWKKDPEVDREIEERFGGMLDEAIAGDLEGWRRQPRSCLALVILLDQFSRNIFRGDARAWAQDEQAQKVCVRALDRDQDQAMKVVERWFLTMPLMHAEDPALLRRCCDYAEQTVAELPEEHREAFASWPKYAHAHRVIVERFGRYPHRNAVLGRESTEEEIAFLKEPGSSF